MPSVRRRCSAHHSPDHKHKPNWHCPRWATNGSDRCRVHGNSQPKNYAPVTVTIEGRPLDEASLRHLVEAQMLRLGPRGPYRR